MADIELRFGHDMLVCSGPVDETLARQGVDVPRDRQYLNLMEPDVVSDALRLQLLAGAHCLVTPTEDITRARLAHVRMEDDAARLAKAACEITAALKPQHVLAEIGPCGLPLDASSKASLNENRIQYADAARAFEDCEIDAFFLNGFTSIADLKCALMGTAQVSGRPVFASVVLGRPDEQGGRASRGVRIATSAGLSQSKPDTLFSHDYEPVEGPLAPAVPVPTGTLDPSCWPEALSVMADLGASVAGFETADPPSRALDYALQAAALCDMPILAQLHIDGEDVAADGDRRRALVPATERDDYSLDAIEHVAVRLYGAGVQFLRATGAATPAYTGALSATVSGLDVRA